MLNYNAFRLFFAISQCPCARLTLDSILNPFWDVVLEKARRSLEAGFSYPY
jgi:hypothetical protein